MRVDAQESWWKHLEEHLFVAAGGLKLHEPTQSGGFNYIQSTIHMEVPKVFYQQESVT